MTKDNYSPKQKRITKPVRVDIAWHTKLKVEATHRGMTMSRLHDAIYADYFGAAEPDTGSNGQQK